MTKCDICGEHKHLDDFSLVDREIRKKWICWECIGEEKEGDSQ